MPGVPMIRATARPNRLRVERKRPIAASVLPFIGTSTKPAVAPSYGRASDLRRGVVAGLLAKREDSSGALIVANGVERSSLSIFRDSAGTVVEFDLGDLVHTTIAVFRSHPHINNVLTHICGARWERIGQALCVILNPLATLNDLSPLARNIVELMCAERGVTGCILKPFFHALLDRILPAQTATYLHTHIWRLFLEMKARDARPFRWTVRMSGARLAVAGGA
jgi:hypothetical protein